jgi:DnaJ-class molecular chaperone
MLHIFPFLFLFFYFFLVGCLIILSCRRPRAGALKWAREKPRPRVTQEKMECVEGVDAKLVTDVLKLVQGFDLKKLVGSMQDGDGSLDTMVASLTRSMLSGDATAAPRDGTIVHTVSLSLHQAQLGKKKKVRVRRTKAGVREQREIVVEIPAGCPDGFEIRVAGEGNEENGAFGDLLVRVSVAEVCGAFYTDKTGLFTRVRLSLADTRRLGLRLKLPGSREVLLAHDDDAPLYGWRVVRGAGLRDNESAAGDLFVLFDLELPALWSAAPTLADVPARHTVESEPSTVTLSLPTTAELDACARALPHVPSSS